MITTSSPTPELARASTWVAESTAPRAEEAGPKSPARSASCSPSSPQFDLWSMFGMLYQWWPLDVAFDVDRSRIECTGVGVVTIDGVEFDIANKPQHSPNPVWPLVGTARRGWPKYVARRKARTPSQLRLTLEQEAAASLDR